MRMGFCCASAGRANQAVAASAASERMREAIMGVPSRAAYVVDAIYPHRTSAAAGRNPGSSAGLRAAGKTRA